METTAENPGEPMMPESREGSGPGTGIAPDTVVETRRDRSARAVRIAVQRSAGSVRTHMGRLTRTTMAFARSAAMRRPAAPKEHVGAPSAPVGAWRTHRKARLRKWAAGGLFVLIVIGTAAGLTALALSQDRPTWWRSVNAKDPAVVAVAERLENAVATILTQARAPSESGEQAQTWTVRVNSSDVNAWLNARLPTWMESREDVHFDWPESLQEIRIDFRDGLIHIGAKVSAAKRVDPDTRSGNYFSAAIEPEFKADGSLWMPARSVALGRLSVPASWMLRDSAGGTGTDRVPEELAKLPETREVLAAFAGRQAVMTNPTIKLGDGRRVKVLAMTAADGKLAITCQTILREPSRADAGAAGRLSPGDTQPTDGP